MLAVVNLALGDHHSVILKQDGSVWSTAIALHGDLAASRGVSKHFALVIPSGARAVAAGTSFSVVLKQDGTVWSMGRNARGQLGDGTKASRHAFLFVKMIVGAKAVAAGSFHSIVMTQEGQVFTTGWNQYGQLGAGSIKNRAYSTRFRQVIGSGAKAVAAGDTHSAVLKQDGSVWATGRNYNGQVGDGSKADRNSFVMVISGGGADVSTGGYHSMVLKQDGSVWATGWNGYGQLGDGSITDRSNYVQVLVSGAEAIAAGRRHSMILKQDGSVWTTGYSVYGQLEDLGDGAAMIDSKFFVQMISDGAKVIAAGAFHSMVLKQDGSIWATGSNEYGQFGDGSTKSQNVFVEVVRFRTGTDMDCFHRCFYHLISTIHSIVGFANTTKASEITLSGRETTSRGWN